MYISKWKWNQFAFLLVFMSSVHAETNLWQDITTTDKNLKIASRAAPVKSSYQQARWLRLDEKRMRQILYLSGDARQMKLAAKPSARFDISLPLPDLSQLTVSLSETQLLPEKLARKLPQIRTFRVMPDAKIHSGKLDITLQGFHGMLQMRNGETVMIDPVKNNNDAAQVERVYASYRKQDQVQPDATRFSCGVKHASFLKARKEDGIKESRVLQRVSSASVEKNLLKYRIAVAATGEYTKKQGGSVAAALSAIVTTLNRVNQVLENDLGIQLTLIPDNDKLIYPDADSDPYTAASTEELLFQNQEAIDAVIGSANYDIGHLLTTSGGGIAAIAAACNDYKKAWGVSGLSNPVNDSFNLDFVAHEIGHQLGATHTFNSSQGLCSGNTRAAKTAFEPGSGSTIMSYAGYCGIDNLQSSTDPMFHIGSIEQIIDYTSSGYGSRCGSRQSLQNRPPVSNAGGDYSIPANTPFELIGSATDPDADRLVYAWEQLDAGDSSAEYEDKGNNALFRVRLPTDNRSREFPSMQSLLYHLDAKGETLPIQQRQMRFSFVAQDGSNPAQSDEMTVNVMRTGSRFALNLPRSQYTLGQAYKVYWNVANTDKAPISCQAVDLTLSVDGGNSFTRSLANQIPNTGTATVIFPTDIVSGSKGRLKLKCSDNIFFAISYRDFLLTEHAEAMTYQHNDEDQPEQGLEDKDLKLVTASTTNAGTSTSGNNGGGSLNYTFLLMIICLGFLRRSTNKMINQN